MSPKAKIRWQSYSFKFKSPSLEKRMTPFIRIQEDNSNEGSGNIISK